MAQRIVITGAPGSGKTKFLERLAGDPMFSHFVFLDELARRLLLEDPTYRQDRRRFHAEIYRRQTDREQALFDRSFVTDRGTVDAFAFHPESLSDLATTLSREYKRYSAVIQLGSAARLGEPYYSCDAVRCESIEDALAIEEAITRVWQGHPGYHFIPARPELEDKYAEFIRLVMHMTPAKGAGATYDNERYL